MFAWRGHPTQPSSEIPCIRASCCILWSIDPFKMAKKYYMDCTLFYAIIMSFLFRSSVNAFATFSRHRLSSCCVAQRTLTTTHVASSSDDNGGEIYQPKFRRGDKIQVEIISFGPLGASVDVIAHKSHDPSDCIPPDEPALGRGMVLQREIDYFRRGRGGVDIVKYETLPAYVENVRRQEFADSTEEEVRLDVSLRPPGGKAKAVDLGEQILQKLQDSDSGVLEVGDKSSPEEINEIFPGASKSAFKKGISALYKRGLVKPGPNSVTLL